MNQDSQKDSQETFATDAELPKAEDRPSAPEEDWNSAFYGRGRGKPLPDRSRTHAAIHALMNSSIRPPLHNVYGSGPLLLSDIHKTCNDDGVIVGIDEAGRGCALGPMVYGAAFWNINETPKVASALNDSKQLTPETRDRLLDEILEQQVGFCVRVLHASEISRNMLRPEPYNLNQMSHDAAMEMIRSILDAGVQIQTCYVDTVGTPHAYKRLLEREFPGIQFVVESKADAKYEVCSAGSIVAKVVRDRMLENWKFSEPGLQDTSNDFGSGYPSDPKCKKWIERELNDKVFGYPDLIRFSWGPTKKALEQGVNVTFAADEDDEEEDDMTYAGRKRQQEQMKAFLGKEKKRRLPYFAQRKLQIVRHL